MSTENDDNVVREIERDVRELLRDVQDGYRMMDTVRRCERRRLPLPTKIGRHELRQRRGEESFSLYFYGGRTTTDSGFDDMPPVDLTDAEAMNRVREFLRIENQ